MSDNSNIINEADAKRWVGEIERFDEEILTIKMENAARQKAVKDRKAAAFERADAAGVPTAALKLELFRRDLERKRKAKESDAGFDRVELADRIKAALGDFAGLPLGGAAVDAAAGGAAPKRKPGRPKKGAAPLVGEDTGAAPKTGADDEPDLRSTRQKENEERLKGIKTLDKQPGVH